MNAILIEPSSQDDYQLFIDLAKRLKAKFTVQQTEAISNSDITNDASFFALAGSLDLPESSEELIKIIEESRTTKDIDTSWTA